MNAQEIIDFIARAPKKTPVKLTVREKSGAHIDWEAGDGTGAADPVRVYGGHKCRIVYGNWADLEPVLERCKDDKQAMNKEVMALYKTYGVNPASGCIPLLIQLPVFFGLYQALLTSIELRHASFITYLPGTDMLWLADLSSKDPYYITPIIMGVTMFIQQRFNPPASDPTQQKIMMALPFVFTILFLGFPSGLVIYWLVNNILSILQQWMMSRKQRLDK